jgi:hypothetical protein
MAVTTTTEPGARYGARPHTVRAAEATEETSEAGAGSNTLQTMSRMIYTGSYALAYGIVYAAVFVAQSLPQENPVMHGFRDGGRAAMEELGAS